jgi:hypothetical protein
VLRDQEHSELLDRLRRAEADRDEARRLLGMAMTIVKAAWSWEHCISLGGDRAKQVTDAVRNLPPELLRLVREED